MKSIYFFSTKLAVYLTELPMIVFLVLAIAYNNNADTLFKLYPLQAALIALMIFTFVYFLRFVKLSADEVRCVGLFSSKDRVALKKNRCLVLTLKKRRKLLFEVFSIGEAPLLDWVNPEDYTNSEINIFRAKSVGGERSAKKMLKYFDIPNDDFSEILESESFEKEYEAIILSATTTDLGRKISLRFTETI